MFLVAIGGLIIGLVLLMLLNHGLKETIISLAILSVPVIVAINQMGDK
jgi:hypothetical protein